MLWLYDIPTWLLALSVIGAFLTASIGGLLFSRRRTTKFWSFRVG